MGRNEAGVSLLKLLIVHPALGEFKASLNVTEMPAHGMEGVGLTWPVPICLALTPSLKWTPAYGVRAVKAGHMAS